MKVKYSCSCDGCEGTKVSHLLYKTEVVLQLVLLDTKSQSVSPHTLGLGSDSGMELTSCFLSRLLLQEIFNWNSCENFQLLLPGLGWDQPANEWESGAPVLTIHTPPRSH